jgi:hypothetical protein
MFHGQSYVESCPPERGGCDAKKKPEDRWIGFQLIYLSWFLKTITLIFSIIVGEEILANPHI